MLRKSSFFRFLFLIIGILFLGSASGKSPDDLSTLPRAAQKALEKVLKGQKIELSLPLRGGFSVAVYKVTASGKSYVLRLMDPKHPRPDREREIKCMQIVSQEGIAPKIYYADAKEGIIIMEFLHHASLTEKERTPKILLPRLSRVLKKIHDGLPFPATVNPQDQIRTVLSELESEKAKLPNLVKKTLALLQQIEIPLQKTARLAPCHNDLNPHNILFTEQGIKIIDWEAAGMGDPSFDLASIALFFAYSPQDEDILLKSYFGEAVTPYQRARFYLLKQQSLCFYGLALLKAYLDHKKSTLSPQEIDNLPDFVSFLKAIGEGREKMSSSSTVQKFAFVAFKQALKNMQTTEFTEALTLLTSHP